MRILVTGGAGFVGSHVVEELLGRGHAVVVLDDLSTGSLENLPIGNGSLKFIEGTILDGQKVAEAISGCHSVIHLAAIASVQASIENPLATHQVNFDGTLLLLEEARKAGVMRFLFASSAAVYGDATSGAISEDAMLSPMTPYAVDKLASEYYLRHYQKAFGIDFTAFRFFNIYGARQNPSSPYSGVISIFVANSLAGKSVRIYGDGKQTRDFVYVKDVSRILADSIENRAMFGRTVNVGTGKSIALLELVEKIGLVTGRKIEVEHLPARHGDIRHSLANVDLLASLGRGASTSILAGLSDAIAYFRG